jgi:hypothetical protein
MNALSPIDAAVDDSAWGKAIGAVNEWRGHSLHCFAQAEAAVSETLLAMASVADRGAAQPAAHRLKGLPLGGTCRDEEARGEVLTLIVGIGSISRQTACRSGPSRRSGFQSRPDRTDSDFRLIWP